MPGNAIDTVATYALMDRGVQVWRRANALNVNNAIQSNKANCTAIHRIRQGLVMMHTQAYTPTRRSDDATHFNPMPRQQYASYAS